MAVINPPAWMQAGSYPARNDRLAITSLLAYPGFLVDESTPMRIRQGVKPSYQQQQLKVRAAATPNMTVIVSAGFAFVDNHDTGGQGTYVCANDSDVTLTIAAAGGAGQYRKDAIVASVYDAETAGSVSEWRLEVIQGTYAASAGAAVRPSLPPNAQILADVSVDASVTSIPSGKISDVRNYSVAAGGILPVSSAAAPNRPHPGQMLYYTDTDRFFYGKLDGTVVELAPKATSWQAITFSGTWVNTGGPTDPPASARWTGDGMLEISGNIKGTAVSAGATSVIGTLPAALWPAYWGRCIVGHNVAQGYGMLAVNPATGQISFVNGSQALTSAQWIQLDGYASRAV